MDEIAGRLFSRPVPANRLTAGAGSKIADRSVRANTPSAGPRHRPPSPPAAPPRRRGSTCRATKAEDARCEVAGQIATLFAADPPLPAGQAERLAVIVPQLMRIPLTLIGEKRLRDGVLEELRLMLSRHLEAGEG